MRYYSSKRKIYRWPLKQTEEDIKEERRKMAAQNVISPAQEARVNQVTRNLVQWGKELVSVYIQCSGYRRRRCLKHIILPENKKVDCNTNSWVLNYILRFLLCI